MDWFHLARQGRFVGVQFHGLDYTRIRADQIARLDYQNVTGHEFFGRDLDPPAVAKHHRMRGRQFTQGTQCPACLVLLRGSQNRVQQHHAGDDGRVDGMAGSQRQRRRAEQQIDQRAVKLLGRQLDHADGLFGLQGIAAILLQAGAHLRRLKALLAGVQLLKQLLLAVAVPQVVCCLCVIGHRVFLFNLSCYGAD
ncbi:MAG: hypothetical protein BWY71_01217 [Planctomycetes bacterium ADurb.Bin412]|nr:MAG: hypothetical protein BWY71_01217 [Planctomycetes bacterium ADurb.Bin412]